MTSNHPVEYTRSGVPKSCPDCGHPFHPAGNCHGLEAGRCPCQRNMAIELPAAEDQHAPSTGQPGVDLRSVRRRIVELVGLMEAEPFTRILDSAERMLREIESLKQQLAAAQAERDEALAIVERQTAVELRILEQHRALLGQVEELRQRASDYETAEGTAVAQRNAALNEALAYKYQAEAMRGVVEVARRYVATNPVTFATMFNALAALDAAIAGQATPSSSDRVYRLWSCHRTT